MFETFTISIKAMDTKFNAYRVEYHVFNRDTAIKWGKQANECKDVITVDVISDLTGEVIYWSDECGEHGDI